MCIIEALTMTLKKRFQNNVIIFLLRDRQSYFIQISGRVKDLQAEVFKAKFIIFIFTFIFRIQDVFV